MWRCPIPILGQSGVETGESGGRMKSASESMDSIHDGVYYLFSILRGARRWVKKLIKEH